jgi:hypothetical protein
MKRAFGKGAMAVAAIAAVLVGCSRARVADGNGDVPQIPGMPSTPTSGDDGGATTRPLPPGHSTPIDTVAKEGPRVLPAETYIRTYMQLFGVLSPLDAQRAAVGKDGAQLFDTWDDYLGVLGLPDYRFDVPRQGQTNALMLATFERLADPLCDRMLEHDRTETPRLVYDFDMPQQITIADFTPRFDVLHRTFLNYPASMAPDGRIARYFALYQKIVAEHGAGDAGDAGASRLKPNEAGWACVCAGLLRHPEFQLY